MPASGSRWVAVQKCCLGQARLRELSRRRWGRCSCVRTAAGPSTSSSRAEARIVDGSQNRATGAGQRDPYACVDTGEAVRNQVQPARHFASSTKKRFSETAAGTTARTRGFQVGRLRPQIKQELLEPADALSRQFRSGRRHHARRNIFETVFQPRPKSNRRSPMRSSIGWFTGAIASSSRSLAS